MPELTSIAVAVKDIGLPGAIILILLLGFLPAVRDMTVAQNYATWTAEQTNRYLEAVRLEHMALTHQHDDMMAVVRAMQPKVGSPSPAFPSPPPVLPPLALP